MKKVLAALDKRSTAQEARLDEGVGKLYLKLEADSAAEAAVLAAAKAPATAGPVAGQARPNVQEAFCALPESGRKQSFAGAGLDHGSLFSRPCSNAPGL